MRNQPLLCYVTIIDYFDSGNIFESSQAEIFVLRKMNIIKLSTTSRFAKVYYHLPFTITHFIT